MKFILIFLISFSAFAAENKSTTKAAIKTAPEYPSNEDFRCEKLLGHTLAEFKQKLVDNCDLNKPFSSSMAKLLNEESYMYCCQIRK